MDGERPAGTPARRTPRSARRPGPGCHADGVAEAQLGAAQRRSAAVRPSTTCSRRDRRPPRGRRSTSRGSRGPARPASRGPCHDRREHLQRPRPSCGRGCAARRSRWRWRRPRCPRPGRQRPVESALVRDQHRQPQPGNVLGQLSRGSSSSASASWGTHFGWTKLVASMVRSPASASRAMNSAFTSTGSSADSFCRPSRGPTSWMRTAGRHPVRRDARGRGPGPGRGFAGATPSASTSSSGVTTTSSSPWRRCRRRMAGVR